MSIEKIRVTVCSQKHDHDELCDKLHVKHKESYGEICQHFLLGTCNNSCNKIHLTDSDGCRNVLNILYERDQITSTHQIDNIINIHLKYLYKVLIANSGRSGVL